MKMKKCPKCKEAKPATLEFFYKGPKPDGFRPYCKSCNIRLAGSWTKLNPGKRKVIKARWIKANPEKEAARLKRVRAERRPGYVASCAKKNAQVKASPTLWLAKRMKDGVRRALGRRRRSKTCEEVLGFTAKQLRVHLERQFPPGMGWHNMDKWHIDHIVPVCSFSYVDENDPEFKACWALTNLAPRWAPENLKKGAKRIYLL